jgi:hypothetical protein
MYTGQATSFGHPHELVIVKYNIHSTSPKNGGKGRETASSGKFPFFSFTASPFV